MIEELTKSAANGILSQGLMGSLLFLSWVLFAVVCRWFLSQIKEAKEETRSVRTELKETTAQYVNEVRNIAKVPASVDNLMPMIKMLLDTHKGAGQ